MWTNEEAGRAVRVVRAKVLGHPRSERREAASLSRAQARPASVQVAA